VAPDRLSAALVGPFLLGGGEWVIVHVSGGAWRWRDRPCARVMAVVGLGREGVRLEDRCGEACWCHLGASRIGKPAA